MSVIPLYDLCKHCDNENTYKKQHIVSKINRASCFSGYDTVIQKDYIALLSLIPFCCNIRG